MTQFKTFAAIVFILALSKTTFAQSQNCNGDPSQVTNLPVLNACAPRAFTTRWWWGGTTYGSCAAGASHQDGWFVVYGTGNPITVSITGSNRNFVLAAFTGCGGIGEVACTYSGGAAGSIVFPSVYGTPYYIQIQRRSGGGFSTHNGNICATSPGTIANDTPCSAMALPVNPVCTYVGATNSPATDSGIGAPSCGNYLGNDVWFAVTVPPSGDVVIQTSQWGFNNGAMAVYSGAACGALTEIACDDDSGTGNMPFINLTGQTPGNTLWIRVWEKGNNVFGGFQICVSETVSCGNPNEDWCDRPATLTAGASNFASSTYPYYTADTPGNSGAVFCGTVENNSWYQFTAGNTTEVFNFSSVINCVNGDGIQAEVYEVSNDAMGCCSVFTSVSNCWNPGTQTGGTVTATGLTIGNTYILMVDGYAGDNCEFVVDNWVASGILLPVELVEFSAASLTNRNVVSWKTVSERDNDYFIVEKSYDGINFEAIGEVDGNGTTQEVQYYSFDDYNIRTGLAYYRLVQVDFNGAKYWSDIVAVDRLASQTGILAVYPNPTSNSITVELNGEYGSQATLQIMDSKGNVILNDNISSKGFSKRTYDLNSFASGIYFVSYKDEVSNSIKKILKH